MPDVAFSLLDYLDTAVPDQACMWRGWRIVPIAGGANNRVYRVTRGAQDYAVKFTIHDVRNRAGREYAALTALQQVGLSIAPQPIWLDRENHRLPVVVQTWLEGEPLTTPPTTDADWAALLEHYFAIHAVTPDAVLAEVPDAVLNASCAESGRAIVHTNVARLPPTARPTSLRTVLARFDAWEPPVWDPPAKTLCRVDPNWRNLIRRPGPWGSVDWENSGWGDPAFEMADLMTHPAYDSVPPGRWRELMQAYKTRCGDPDFDLRVTTYTTILRVWWVVRSARYLYEVPRGLDPRLTPRSDHWRPDTERLYAQHVSLAEAHLTAT